jgi:hypothetical protein
MTLLKDAPGGQSLIAALTGAVRDLALLYAATHDDRAQASLKTYIDRIGPELVTAIGAGAAKSILEAFASVVMTEKHKIESGGISRA